MMIPRPHPTRWLLFALAASTALLATRAARAGLTVDYQSGGSGCAEAAAYFPEDMSPEATRAQRRCHLETFEQRIEDDRLQKQIEREGQRDKLVESWMQQQSIPARVMRRNSIDGYLSGGLTSYGLAAGGVILPWLEGELWIGRRNVNEAVKGGYLDDSRTCYGGRFKWLMRGRGNLTPFASAGAASCSASLSYYSYNFTTPGGPVFDSSQGSGYSVGDGAAHLVTASAGLAWTDKSGLRASLEYTFAYAFYSQATLDDAMRTEDPGLHAAWDNRLTSDRGGFRVQVGYAF